jgi:hypothetical protein
LLIGSRYSSGAVAEIDGGGAGRRQEGAVGDKNSIGFGPERFDFGTTDLRAVDSQNRLARRAL